MNNKYPIHPDFATWQNFHPPINKASISLMQNLMGLAYLGEKPDATVNVEKFKIPYGGDKEMRAIMYAPFALKTPSPCLIYFHGGGFVLPAAPYHYNNCRRYATGAHCKVLFVDYPLSPKARHPVHMNACFDAYKWLLDHAEEYQINPKKIAVGGDSAGGGLAVTISMLAKEQKIQKPCGQMLNYPLVMTPKPTPSMKKFTDTPLCNSHDCKKYEKYYFASEEDRTDPYVLFICQKDFSYFPPTYVETAEFDCLRDGAIMFAEKLEQNGIKATLHKTEGTIHAYDMCENSSITKESLIKRIDFLNTVFKHKK